MYIEQLGFLNDEFIYESLKSFQLEGYEIKKDHHSPNNRKIIFHASSGFSLVCMLDKSCLYSFSDSSSAMAINKIFGYSFGSNHHNNSFRIGWRCKDGLFEILAYWYINHERFDKHLFYVRPGKRCYITVNIDNKKANVNYLIEDGQPENKVIIHNPKNLDLKKWGYINYPYFGGKNKAPNDMVVYLKTWGIE